MFSHYCTVDQCIVAVLVSGWTTPQNCLFPWGSRPATNTWWVTWAYPTHHCTYHLNCISRFAWYMLISIRQTDGSRLHGPALRLHWVLPIVRPCLFICASYSTSWKNGTISYWCCVGVASWYMQLVLRHLLLGRTFCSEPGRSDMSMTILGCKDAIYQIWLRSTKKCSVHQKQREETHADIQLYRLRERWYQILLHGTSQI